MSLNPCRPQADDHHANSRMSRFERALSPSRRLFRQRGWLARWGTGGPRALATAGRWIGTLVFVALGGLAGGMLELPSTRRGWGALVLAAGAVVGGVVWWRARR